MVLDVAKSKMGGLHLVRVFVPCHVVAADFTQRERKRWWTAPPG